MKITKKQLRKIISENVGFAPMQSRASPMIRAAVSNSRRQGQLKENMWRHPKTGENMLLMVNDLVSHMLDQGVDAYELAEELKGIALDVLGSQFQER
jgi:hypothetical protein